MRILPASGLKIWDPIRRDYLPPEGRDVPDGDLYWARAIQDGDVSVAAPEPAAPEPPTPAAEVIADGTQPSGKAAPKPSRDAPAGDAA